MALALGYKHPDALLSRISSRQWSEWVAYYRVEPFGHDIGFSLLAAVCSILANVYRKKGAKAVRASDFYSKMTLSSRKQSTEEMKAIFMGLVGATKDAKQPKVKVRDKRNG